MLLANRVFRPFETLIDPLNIPITPLPDKGPIQLVWHFAKMFRLILAAVSVLSILTGLISLGVVWMLAYIVDGVVADGASVFVSDNLVLLVACAIVLIIIEPLLSFIDQCFMSQTVGTLMPAAMRWRAHKAVEGQDVAFFEDQYAGQVASRIEQVTGSVRHQMLIAIEQIPHFIIQFVGSLSLLIVLAWPLAIPVFCWIVAQAVLAVFVTPKLKDRSSNVAEASSRATGAMTDVYSNIATVKAFSAEAAESHAIRQVLSDTIKTRHREQRIIVASITAVRLLNAMLAIAVFIVGIWGLIDGFVSIGDFVAVVTIARGLFGAAFEFIGLGFSISESYGTIRDAMPIITSKPTLLDKEDAKPFALNQGEIVFDNVSYSYLDAEKSDADENAGLDTKAGKDAAKSADDENSDDLESDDEEKSPPKPVITNMNLTITPGEKVGLVGLSGAGKSTAVSLLLRLRDIDAGAIRIDGQDVRDVTQVSLRNEIGVITQDVFLLNRSIRDNVKYGAPSATDEQIKHALHLAKALDFVEDLTDKEKRVGLDAHVGERGVKLSGGQRQRLAIARAILKDAKIWLLDEATSALDSEAETEIQQNLQQLMNDKTALVIAHRLSTIAAMDRLVVLNKGKIEEQGTHSELVKLNGLYARLWHKQSGGFLASE